MIQSSSKEDIQQSNSFVNSSELKNNHNPNQANQNGVISLQQEIQSQQSAFQNSKVTSNQRPDLKLPQVKQIQMIDEATAAALKEPNKLRGYEWIQSCNKEDFEIMKNICYLEQFLDMNDDFKEVDLIYLDIPQFVHILGNYESESASILSDDAEMDDVFEDQTAMYIKDIIKTKPSQNQMIDETGLFEQEDKGAESMHILNDIVSSQNNEDSQAKHKNDQTQVAVKQKGKKISSQTSLESSKEQNDDIFSQINQKGKAKKYQTSLSMLAQDQFIRISKYGDIALNQNIARRNPKSDDFYDQEDSFIDDDQVDTELKQLAICEADYDDFFMVDGGLKDLVKSDAFKVRLNDIQEYRDTKKLEIHLRIDKQKEEDEKPKVQQRSKQNRHKQLSSRSKMKQSQNPKLNMLFDKDDEDDKQNIKGRKNQKSKQVKPNLLHLKQPTFVPINEKSFAKKMIAEQETNVTKEQINQPKGNTPIQTKNNQTKERTSSNSEKKNQKRLKKSLPTNNEQMNNDKTNPTQARKKNASKFDETVAHIKNKMIEIKATPTKLEQTREFIIINDDDDDNKDKDANKLNNLIRSPQQKQQEVVQKISQKQIKHASKPESVVQTPQQQKKQDRKSIDNMNKSQISIHLSSQKKSIDNSNGLSMSIIAKPILQNEFPLNTQQDEQENNKQNRRGRSKRNTAKDVSRDNQSIDNITDISQIGLSKPKKPNNQRNLNNNLQKYDSNTIQYINDQTIKRTRSQTTLNSNNSSSANLDQDAIKQVEKQQQNDKKLLQITKIRSSSVVGNKKIFLEEQPLEFRESKIEGGSQLVRRKIINPKRRSSNQKDRMIDEVIINDAQTQQNNKQQSENDKEKEQMQSGASLNELQVKDNQGLKKKKIIKIEKRKREKDISEEAEIHNIKADKKTKQ